MGELQQHPLPMTIDEQIANLKSLGLIIENEEYAKKILNDISYFRLIKAYSLGFKPKNGKYEEGVTFEQIVELYLFNACLLYTSREGDHCWHEEVLDIALPRL